MGLASIFDNQALERVRQLFIDQFEPDGKDFLYRKSGKGHAIRVTAAERDKFITAFEDQNNILLWGLIVMMLLALGVALPFLETTKPNPYAILALVLGLVLILLPVYSWIWNAPARSLKGRPLIGDARSSAEYRRRYLSRMSYGQIGAMSSVLILPLAKIDFKKEMLSDENAFWFGSLLFMLAAIATLLFLKLGYDSKKK